MVTEKTFDQTLAEDLSQIEKGMADFLGLGQPESVLEDALDTGILRQPAQPVKKKRTKHEGVNNSNQ